MISVFKDLQEFLYKNRDNYFYEDEDGAMYFDEEIMQGMIAVYAVNFEKQIH